MRKILIILITFLLSVWIGCDGLDQLMESSDDEETKESIDGEDQATEDDDSGTSILSFGTAEIVAYLISDNYSIPLGLVSYDENTSNTNSNGLATKLDEAEEAEELEQDDDYDEENLKKYTHCRYTSFDKQGKEKILKKAALNATTKKCHLKNLPEEVGGLLTYYNSETDQGMDVIIPVLTEDEVTEADPPSKIDQIQADIHRKKVAEMITNFKDSGLGIPREVLMDPSEIMTEITDEAIFEDDNATDLTKNVEAFAKSFAAAQEEEIVTLLNDQEFTVAKFVELKKVVLAKQKVYRKEMKAIKAEFSNELSHAGGSKGWNEEKRLAIAAKISEMKLKMKKKREEVMVEKQLLDEDDLDEIDEKIQEKRELAFVKALDSSMTEDSLKEIDLSDDKRFSKYLRPPHREMYIELDKMHKAEREIERLYEGGDADVEEKKAEALESIKEMREQLLNNRDLNGLKSIKRGNVVDSMVLKIGQDAIEHVAGGVDIREFQAKLKEISDIDDDFATKQQKIEELSALYLEGVTNTAKRKAILRSIRGMVKMERHQRRKLSDEEKENFDFGHVMTSSHDMKLDDIHHNMETLGDVTVKCERKMLPEECIKFGYTVSKGEDGCPVHNCNSAEDIQCPVLGDEEEFKNMHCGNREVIIHTMPNGCKRYGCKVPEIAEDCDHPDPCPTGKIRSGMKMVDNCPVHICVDPPENTIDYSDETYFNNGHTDQTNGSDTGTDTGTNTTGGEDPTHSGEEVTCFEPTCTDKQELVKVGTAPNQCPIYRCKLKSGVPCFGDMVCASGVCLMDRRVCK